MKFPFLTNAQIDREAEHLRLSALGANALAIPVDLEAIVYDHLYEQEGLVICDDEELADEDGDVVLGKLEIGPGRIHLNAAIRNERGRYRFTLAHEIGHWRLHRPLLLAEADQPSLFGTGEARPVFMTTLNRAITGLRPPSHEVQANRFAATLLISPRALAREVNNRFGPDGLKSLLGPIADRPIRERGRLIAANATGSGTSLAAAFDVSIEAMAIALESRGYLDPTPGLI